MTPQAIKNFTVIASYDVAYKPDAKRLFHTRAKKALRQIADDLGLKKGEYDLRSNQGGIAVSGEITLHSNKLYLQFSQVCGMPGVFMYRACNGRKDYSGKVNRWLSYEALQDTYHACIAAFLREMQ